MLYSADMGLDMVQTAVCCSEIPPPCVRPPVPFSDFISVCSITRSELRPVYEWLLQSCTRVKISRPDPTGPVNLWGFLDPTRPDPTRSPINNGKRCKTNNELNVFSLLCAHTHECATQIQYASTRSRFHWLLISPARMPQRRQLNTDAYQTPPSVPKYTVLITVLEPVKESLALFMFSAHPFYYPL